MFAFLKSIILKQLLFNHSIIQKSGQKANKLLSITSANSDQFSKIHTLTICGTSYAKKSSEFELRANN